MLIFFNKKKNSETIKYENKHTKTTYRKNTT